MDLETSEQLGRGPKKSHGRGEIWSVFPRGAVIASRLSVAGRLLVADHVERRDSAYASGGVAEAGRARRSLRTGRSGDSWASCFALYSVLTVLADAWSTRGTWG